MKINTYYQVLGWVTPETKTEHFFEKKCSIQSFFLSQIVYRGCYEYFRFSEKKDEMVYFHFENHMSCKIVKQLNENCICYQQSISIISWESGKKRERDIEQLNLPRRKITIKILVDK